METPKKLLLIIFAIILISTCFVPQAHSAETIQIADGFFFQETDINSQDNVIWQGDGIFLYDGLDSNFIGNGSNTQLNNAGQVAWEGIGPIQTPNIFYYDGLTSQQLTNEITGNGIKPLLNDVGQIAWEGVTYIPGTEFNFSSHGIFLSDGATTTQIWDQPLSSPTISAPNNHLLNNLGQVVWTASETKAPYLYDGTNPVLSLLFMTASRYAN